MRRLARINQGMMWIVSGLTAAAMIVAPYLGLDQLIRQLGNALKTVIRWLLLLIPNSPVEEETMATEQAQQAMPAVGNQAPWFLELFYKLLDLIGWMIGIGTGACVCISGDTGIIPAGTCGLMKKRKKRGYHRTPDACSGGRKEEGAGT